LNFLKQHILLNFKNIPGWRLNRKVVVIECDDWGSIRMPSKKVYNKLLSAGFPVDKNRYTINDTLEDQTDLEHLFEALKSVNDKNGNPAVLTPVCNVANPDFEKIRHSNFAEYFNEPFTRTMQRYGLQSDSFSLWLEGIEKGIFVPESHGREHLSVQLWMQKLQERDKKVRFAFDHEYISGDTDGIPKPARQFRPEFYFNSSSQIPFLEYSIKDGIELFTSILGHKPTVFVPSNGVFHPVLEKSLASTGVPFLYGGYWDKVYHLNGTSSHINHIFGQKSKSGMRYYMRNCVFEPTDKAYKGIDLTIKQIEAAFRWYKPAIIGSHRVNFVGGINIKNREMGLKELRILLKTITKKWPDVEFASSRDLFRNWHQEE